ncbi:hypothetical protein MKX03_009963 [Papaver bracteatum]|nr:hypothetical protein MKX03_009963 [Papaver bracteatum]
MVTLPSMVKIFSKIINGWIKNSTLSFILKKSDHTLFSSPLSLAVSLSSSPSPPLNFFFSLTIIKPLNRAPFYKISQLFYVSLFIHRFKKNIQLLKYFQLISKITRKQHIEVQKLVLNIFVGESEDRLIGDAKVYRQPIHIYKIS